MLRAHGYRTAAVGKWHVGMAFPMLPEEQETFVNRGHDLRGRITRGPVDNGFDEFFGTYGNIIQHPHAYVRGDRLTGYPDQPWVRPSWPTIPIRYVAPDYEPLDVLDRLTAEAVAYIGRSAVEDAPFFLYFSLTAPHVPLVPAPRFQGVSGLGPYGDFVLHIDWAVGQVLDALEDAGVADETLVVFTSDNGSYMSTVGSGTDHTEDRDAKRYRGENHRPNGDFRGTKADIYEGGHRVPFLVRWPGIVPANAASAFAFAHVDLYATVAEILGHRLRDREALDSLSLLPVLRGEEAPPRRALVHHSANGTFAVRSGSWKLVLGAGSGSWAGGTPRPFSRPYQLYDLSGAPSERDNRIGTRSALAEALEARLGVVRASAARTEIYSSEASLEDLSMSGIALDAFRGEVPTYVAARVANDVAATTVTADPTDEYAHVVISDGTNRTVGRQAAVDLAEGRNAIEVTVTAENMYTTKTYLVAVVRGAGNGPAGAGPEIAGGAGFTVAEGASAVAALTATDPDTDAEDLVWWIPAGEAGGADRRAFLLTQDGLLSFAVAQDFEAPRDADADGAYHVAVRVTDGARTDTADLTVTLRDVNEAPVADAGPDRDRIGGGATVTLHGSGTDRDAGDWLTHAWTQTGGPRVTLSDAAAASPTFTVPDDLADGTELAFSLRVTDRAGLFDEDSVTVTVGSGALLRAAFENAPVSHDGAAPFTVDLRFSEPVRLSYRAFEGGLLTLTAATQGPARRVGEGAGVPWRVMATPHGDDDVVITLPADLPCDAALAPCTADGRRLAEAASVRIEGPGPGAAPEISGPSELSVPEGSMAVATLTAADADTAARDLTWEMPAGAAGGPDRDRFGLTPRGALSFLAAKDHEAPDDADRDGAYRLTVRVRDRARADTADLTVRLANVNEAPRADAGPDRQDVEGGATVTLGGLGTDPDRGDTLTYSWTQTGGTSVTLSSAVGASPTFTAPDRDGELTFTLRVTDAAGLYGEDTVSVTVRSRARASVVAAAGPVTEGGAATFTMRLSKPAPEALSVAVSATETGDMLAAGPPATVAFAKGDTTATLRLATDDDRVVEDDSAVTATLGAGRGYALGAAASATTVVEDNDTAAFSMAAAPALIEEGGAARITVSIDNGVTFAQDRTVTLAVTGLAAADYRLSPASAVLAAGASSVATTFEALRDSEEEPRETARIDATLAAAAIGSISVAVVDPGPPPGLRGVAQVGNVLEAVLAGAGVTEAGYEWLRDGAPIPGAMESTYALGEADADRQMSVRVHLRGRWRDSAPTPPVWPAPANPPLARGDEELLATTITLATHDGSAKEVHGYSGLSDRAFGAVTDAAFAADGRALSLFAVNEEGLFGLATAPEITDAAGIAAYWNGHAIGPLASSPGFRGTTFWLAPTTQPPERYGRYRGGASDGVRVAVSLRRPLPAATVAAEAERVPEGAPAVFRVELDRPAWSALSVAVTVTESETMLSGAPATAVAFAAGDSAQTLTVATSDDAVIESDSTLTVAVGTGDGYAVGTASAAEMTVEDDDTATWNVAAAHTAIEEGGSTTLTVTVGNGKTFAREQSIVLAAAGTAGPSDYRLTSSPLTLAAGSATTTATLTAVDDRDAEPAETVTVTASHGASSIGSATVTIAANDEPPAQVLAVTVTPQVESLSVTWTAVAGAEGYRVQWRRDGEEYAAAREHTVSGGLTSQTIEGLEGDNVYWVQVAATRAGAAAGPWSAEVSATPRAATAGHEDGDLRLVGGGEDHEGRVEIYHDGVWGTVCDDYWSVVDARVACRQLGYANATEAPRRARFGQGSGPIWMDNVQCSGNETALADCRFRGWGVHNCKHAEDAGAVCATGVDAAAGVVGTGAAVTPGAGTETAGPAGAARANGRLASLGEEVDAVLGGRPAADLRVLDLTDGKHGDLSGIERLTGLRELRLRGNAVADISLLAGLRELRELDLSDNAVADLWPLAGLSNLERLDLSDNHVSDLAPLVGMARLSTLMLDDNALADVSPLAQLPGLVRLHLSRNRVGDLSPLYGATALRELALAGNAVSELWPLARLSRLQRLDLSGNRVEDASPLAGLSHLQVLDLTRNRIELLDGLSGLDRLRTLKLDGNRLSTLYGLAGLASVEALSLRDNPVEHIRPLAELVSLRWLDLRGTPVSDPAPLRSRPVVVWVGNRIEGQGARDSGADATRAR